MVHYSLHVPITDTFCSGMGRYGRVISLFFFMAFISNEPKFPSSNSADLNFCQGNVSFLLVFT